MYIHIYLHMHMLLDIYVYIKTNTYIHIYTYIHSYVYIYKYIIYVYMYIHTYTYTHPHTVLLACDCNLLHGHIQGRLADTVLRHSSAGVIPNTPHPTRTADYLLSLACLRTRGVRGIADKGVSRDAVGKSCE